MWVWGLWIVYWGLAPIPNPQSPIPNTQSPSKTDKKILIKIIYKKNNNSKIDKSIN